MEIPTDELILHDWVIRQLHSKYSRMYSEVRINPSDSRVNEHNGLYPDAVFINYGQVTHVVEVETESTISSSRIPYWKELSAVPGQTVLLVPKSAQSRLRDLLWGNSLVDRIKVGTYDVAINI